MCGLVGIAGKGINAWDIDIFEELLYVSGLRGQDSTGVLQARYSKEEKDNHVMIEKGSQDVALFRQYHKHMEGGNRNIFRGVMNTVFAGHVRHATKGSVTAENAHPFDVGSLVGMHNGTLVDPQYRHYMKTDSELLMKDIEKRGVIPVLKKLDPGSAYALVLYDKKTGRLTFARNKHRSLYFCINATRSVIYWASEEWMLRGILDRNREGIYKNKIVAFDDKNIYSLLPHELPSGTDRLWDIEKFTPDPPKYHTYPVVSRITWKDNRMMEPLKEETPKLTIVPTNGTVLKDTKNNKFIPAYHCCACNNRLSLVEHHFAVKLGSNTFLCKGCEEDHNKETAPFDLDDKTATILKEITSLEPANNETFNEAIQCS